MQYSCLLQHMASTVHRTAVQSFLAPDKPVSACLPYNLEQQALWKGNVPQPDDWLRAWRACRTPSSFLAALAFFQTEDYAAGRQTKVKWNGFLHKVGMFGRHV